MIRLVIGDATGVILFKMTAAGWFFSSLEPTKGRTRAHAPVARPLVLVVGLNTTELKRRRSIN